MNITDLLAIASLMHEVGQRIVMPRFGGLLAGEVRAKSAVDDLVTVADIEAEAALNDGLQKLFPGCGVIGEESVTSDFDYAADDILFVIDPVDGTWPFAHGLPVFGIMISVLARGRAIGGLIHYPVTQETLLVLRQGGVHKLRQGSAPTQLPMLKQDTSVITGMIPLSLFDKAIRVEMMRAFGELPRVVTVQCSAYEYRMLAEGQADFGISTALKPWDHHTGQLMLCELGGYSATAKGDQWPNVQPHDRLISARNFATWQAVVAMLDGCQL
ncbi:inositol monophosphatase family protein [Paracoccus laeviglucosivorans]|uniref:Fructose-1,6-bisphosphatase n=1 Tax=Paracoccus laeviglucosivorans TaxID=1197861 RepID=A0A521ENR4_9RHOB|nr:inositol monophosphatase [Paracoccus laeviglucosivorans]SMO84770.1 fructose-1,6-bisphosphatase [Paracoccus laeviglucosivorans]